MHSRGTQSPALKLSICIPTFNRAKFIEETLESILPQMTDDCEVVVLDGASTDNTAQVVAGCAQHCDRLRYVRQERNNGFDRDLDRVVELASGEYCWLMADDDLLKPGAVAAVLKTLGQDPSLVIVNVECRDFSMVKVVQPRWLGFESNRVYGPEEMDRLFTDVGEVLRYYANMVVKRAIWLARDRQKYFDSGFGYLGVILQKRLPGGARVIAEPLMIYRMSNSHTFTSRWLEILWVRWPSVVRSLDLSDSAKSTVSVTPWRRLLELMLCRALGFYSLADYRQLIRPQRTSIRDTLMPAVVAVLPSMLVKVALVLYYLTGRRSDKGTWWQSTMFLHRVGLSALHVRNRRPAT
jgi:abequosyltransferase